MVEQLGMKMWKSRLRWYGHVMRRDQEYVGRRVMKMELPGKRKRGSLERRFLDIVKEDMGGSWCKRDRRWKQGAVEEHYILWQPLIEVRIQKKKNFQRLELFLVKLAKFNLSLCCKIATFF